MKKFIVLLILVMGSWCWGFMPSGQYKSTNIKKITAADNIITEYNWLAHSDRNAVMGALSNTNRRTIILDAGTYATTNLIQLVPYVDIIGAGTTSIIANTGIGADGMGIQVPISVSANEVSGGVTNKISNLKITSNAYCLGSARTVVPTLTYTRYITVINCTLDGGADDIIFSGIREGGVTIDVFSSTLLGDWDAVACIRAGNNVKLYNCTITPNCPIDSLKRNASNVLNRAAALYAVGGNIEAYNCTLSSVSDQTDGTDADEGTNSWCIYTGGTGGGTITAVNCSISSTGTAKGTGVAESHGVESAGNGSVLLGGCTITSSGSGGTSQSILDLNQEAGTLNASPSVIYDNEKVFGTITAIDELPVKNFIGTKVDWLG